MLRGKICKDIVGDACGMKERYEGIDGLKAYAILGIALMHILANGKYEASGFVFDQLIPSFTNLVFLFYDGQRFWHVLRLLPEIQGTEKSVWESSTPKGTARSGHISHCSVWWTS